MGLAVSQVLHEQILFDDEPMDRCAVERGMAWPVLTEEPGNAVALSWIAPLLAEGADHEGAVVVDRQGHRRQAYQGLLWYATFQAVRSSDRVLLDSDAESAVGLMDHLRTEVETAIASLKPGDLPAGDGDTVAGLIWKSLALYAGGELLHDDRFLRTSIGAARLIASRQQASGAYLLPSRSDNPETLWFHELQIVHAVASLGMQAADAGLVASARRAAEFHLNETQPDHATNQPWGLPAFLIHADTHVMADALLHAANVEQPRQLSGVSLILIADALYSCRRR